MVTSGDMLQTEQYARQLSRLLALQLQGGFSEPITGNFTPFTATQLSSLTARIQTILASLQAQVAALV